jgi:hypothetical protein
MRRHLGLQDNLNCHGTRCSFCMTLLRTEKERDELFVFEIITIVGSIFLAVCILATGFVVLKFKLISRIRVMLSGRPESMLSQRQVNRPEDISSSGASSPHNSESFSDSDSSDGHIP